jgi:quercetin dioxygenase-like cupin family protein
MRWTRTLLTILTATAAAAAPAAATPPAGVVTNVILAQGPTTGPIKERAQAGPWAVSLEDRGDSDVYFQDLVIGPGGYTGWHSHPGIVVLTVKEGAVEFYDEKCARRTFTAGQSFTEGSEAHAAMNRGTVNTRLLIAYITKRGESRRIEMPQPPCAASLGIP